MAELPPISEKTIKTITSKIKPNKLAQELPKCGIVMPISEIDGCSAEHWKDVLGILKDVITEAGFEPKLVSEAEDIGVIHQRIVQNIYNNDMIVCDVSARNPNVMFELGLRLAFDKPTILIKDHNTSFSFDTGVIEHIGYPRDLRFNRMVEFKETLHRKLKATFDRSKEDPGYSPFLKNFGEYKVAKIEQTELEASAYIVRAISDLSSEVARMRMELREAKSDIGFPNYSIAPTTTPLTAGRVSTSAKRLDPFYSLSSNEDQLISPSALNMNAIFEMNLIRAIDNFMAANKIKSILTVRKKLPELTEFVLSKPDIMKFCANSESLSQALDAALAKTERLKMM